MEKNNEIIRGNNAYVSMINGEKVKFSGEIMMGIDGTGQMIVVSHRSSAGILRTYIFPISNVAYFHCEENLNEMEGNS